MKGILAGVWGLGVMAALLLGGCASTQLNSVWKDPAYQAHPKKIMVVGVAKNPMKRRIFEDEFVVQLKARGTDAIASYTVLADKKQEDQEAIAARVKELGADTVLITRLVSKKTVKVYVPGTPYLPPSYYGRWYDYYGYGYQHMYSPGYVAEEQFAVMETNLYDADKDNLIWASNSETEISGSDQDRIREYIGIMVKNMAENRLLNK
jgi:Ni,Fe-hydrogenase III small subunit